MKSACLSSLGQYVVAWKWRESRKVSIIGNLQGGAIPVTPHTEPAIPDFKGKKTGRQVDTDWVPAIWPLKLAVCQVALCPPCLRSFPLSFLVSSFKTQWKNPFVSKASSSSFCRTLKGLLGLLPFPSWPHGISSNGIFLHEAPKIREQRPLLTLSTLKARKAPRDAQHTSDLCFMGVQTACPPLETHVPVWSRKPGSDV